jgi:hypothetical protein
MKNHWYERSKGIPKKSINEVHTGEPEARATPMAPEADDMITDFRKDIMQSVMPKFIQSTADSMAKSVLNYSNQIMAKMAQQNLPGEQEALTTMLYSVMSTVSSAVAANRSSQILNEIRQSQEAGTVVDAWFSQLEGGMNNGEPTDETSRSQPQYQENSQGGEQGAGEQGAATEVSTSLGQDSAPAAGGAEVSTE